MCSTSSTQQASGAPSQAFDPNKLKYFPLIERRKEEGCSSSERVSLDKIKPISRAEAHLKLHTKRLTHKDYTLAFGRWVVHDDLNSRREATLYRSPVRIRAIHSTRNYRASLSVYSTFVGLSVLTASKTRKKKSQYVRCVRRGECSQDMLELGQCLTTYEILTKLHPTASYTSTPVPKASGTCDIT